MNPTPLLEHGLQLHRGGDLDAAQAIYEQALRQNPNDAYALYLLGVLHSHRGKLDEAALLLRKAVAKDRRNLPYYHALASVLEAQNKPDAAIRQLQLAVRADPKNVETHAKLAELLRKTGAVTQAIAHLQRIVTLNPRLSAAHNLLGNLLRSRRDDTGAIKAYERALAVDPINLRARYNLRDLRDRQARTACWKENHPVQSPAPAGGCAIVTPVGPGHEALYEQCRDSIERAWAHSRGVFTELIPVRVDDTRGQLGRSRARNHGVAQAVDAGADWIFFLDADDLMHQNAFAAVAPYVQHYDAIWGLISCIEGSSDTALSRDDQLECVQNINDILFAGPFYTLQMGHFVRTRTALAVPFNTDMDTGEDVDYYLRVWDSHTCIKVPQQFFVNRRGQHSVGPRSASGRQWDEAAARNIRAYCETHPTVVTVERKGIEARFRITNPSDLIQRHLIAGVFFELSELEYIAERVPPGSVILDVGANIGDHTIFYGHHMQPSRVVPFEPHPAAIALLCENIALNRLENVDTSKLGKGVGKCQGKFAIQERQINNLGATALASNTEGTIDVYPLDDLVEGKVDFIKIDVEGMELDVLQGAARILRESSPLIYIEVMNDHQPRFFDWMAKAGYSIEKEFRYIHAVNYFLRATE